MAQEQHQVWKCTLCGAHKGSYSYYHGDKDESLYLCTDCLKSVTKSVGRDQLEGMTAEQLRRHMEVRDELAAAYRDSFAATKTFCVGKKRDIPVLEIDEERGLWALPHAQMPLAQTIKSIVDIEVVLSSEELNADDEFTEAAVESLGIRDLLAQWLPGMRKLLTKLYASDHVNLAPIPEGHFVDFLHLKLTLDDQEAGLEFADIDLLPFWLSLPSRVRAGYDCAYELIEFVKQLKYRAYERRGAFSAAPDLTRNDRLSALAAQGQVTNYEARVLRYYLDRIPSSVAAGPAVSPYDMVKTVADAVSAHIIFGEKAPDWKTQHTVGFEAFLGAFYRYAGGLSADDVVYLTDDTKIHSGKGGMLLAQHSFAADSLAQSLGTADGATQPIAYDDLLCVQVGEGKGQLVLVYKDGRRIQVNGGKYAHYLFATINCILLLRTSS